MGRPADLTSHEDLPQQVDLRLRLELMLRRLRVGNVAFGVEEASDALAVLRVTGLDAPDALRARLRAVLVKTSDVEALRVFDEAFALAFAPDADVFDPIVSRPLPSVQTETDDVDAEPALPGLTPKKASRNLLWVPVALIASVILLPSIFTVWQTDFRSTLDAITGQPGEVVAVPDLVPDHTGQDEGQTNAARPNQAAPVQQAHDVFEIALALILATDTEGRVNLRTIADLYSPGVSEGQKQVLLLDLAQLSGLDPNLAFRLTPETFQRIVMATYFLTRNAELISPENASAVNAVTDADLTESFAAELMVLAEATEILLDARPVFTPDLVPNLFAALNTKTPLSDTLGEELNLTPAEMQSAFADTLERRVAQITASSGELLLGETTQALWPRWSIFVTAVSVPLVFLLWRLVTYRGRVKAWLHLNPSGQGFAPRYQSGLEDALADVVGAAKRVRAARDLARPALVESTLLDPGRSAIATAENGGRFTPVLAQDRRTPRYLALIIRDGNEDHQARRYLELIKGLGMLRAAIETWYIDGSSNTVFRADNPRRVTLQQLHRKLPDHRLLVLGEGDVFLRPSDGKVLPFAQTVRRWPFQALLTPNPTKRWGPREAQLLELFDGRLGLASPDGLAALARAARTKTAAEMQQSWEEHLNPPVWLLDPDIMTRRSAPGPLMLERLRTDLAAELDEDGLHWLRAVAVYPALNWDLTLFLGQYFTRSDGRNLLDPIRFERLSNLPWFREGNMPDWVRSWLIEGLSAEDKTRVISLIHARLSEAETDPAASSKSEIAFVVADDASDYSNSKSRIHQNEVWLELLAKHPPDARVLEADMKLVDKNEVPRSAFLRKELLVGFSLVLTAVAVVLTSPWPGSGVMVMPGSYLPSALCLLLGILIYSGLTRIPTNTEKVP